MTSIAEQGVAVGPETIDATPHPRLLAVLGDIEFAPWECLAELIDVSVGTTRAERRRAAADRDRRRLVRAHDSREVAGIARRQGGGSALLVAAPGSRGGIWDTLGVIGDLIGYILDQADGAGHS